MPSADSEEGWHRDYLYEGENEDWITFPGNNWPQQDSDCSDWQQQWENRTTAAAAAVATVGGDRVGGGGFTNWSLEEWQAFTQEIKQQEDAAFEEKNGVV